jgi:DNA-binding NarL/FixJ family response regulator
MLGVTQKLKGISGIGANAQPWSPMPVMNGVQTAYEIRRIAPSTKIIFFTLHDSPESMAAGRAIGVDAFVAKAAAGTDLIPTVQRVLEIA